MADKFVHLHQHSEYSLLDGLTKIKKLTSRIQEMGMHSVALTDHGVMYGAIEFYKQCLKDGVKPIVGMEAYTTTIDHKLRPAKGEAQTHHLVLLAKNEEGYRNLMKITSIAHLEGFYYKPRIYNEVLAKYSKGIICTSACPAGELASHLIDNDYKGALETAKWFSQVFGEDYYLEVQRHNSHTHIKPGMDPEIARHVQELSDYEKNINEGVIKISRELGIPIVATNDAHYLNKEDATAQDVLVCVATGTKVQDVKRIRFIDTPEFYVKSPEEMEELFPDLPEAISNTVKVADKCNLEISTLGKWFFPKFDLPSKQTPEDYLKKMAHEKLKELVADPSTEYKDRLNHELEIICNKGYAPYFLIVMNMVNWANETGIITNTRGSAAGSLVSFVLGITTVDPLKYYLPFERFLNPFRPSPPDIDFDVSDTRRDEIIGYIADTYGHDKVAQICTFGRMLARAAARDVARVLDYPYATGDKISKLIPPPKQGFPIDVPKALETSPELKNFYDSDKDAKIILDLAHQVEGSARHLSVHAAGVVVAPTSLDEFSPTQKDPSGEKLITQYEMHACEDVGLIKFDILGIRNLSILGGAVEIVQKLHNKKIDLKKIPLDDAKTFEMLGKGDTMGVFQMGSSGMTKWIKELKPTRVEDLMAMVALYRPGPMATIPEYIARKKDNSKVKFLDSRMEKFLGASYGLLVYQDDLLFCALELAGYNWEEVDKFRKAVGKKIPEEMAAQKEKFIDGVVKNGQTKKFAEDLWVLFEPFQAYGFNKAHAASYGIVAYQTAYMKANYPAEYMCALLSAESGDTEKITEGISECRRMGINILPPDINESDVGFTIVPDDESLSGQAIRFGLSAIKNVGTAAIEAILVARTEKKFVSLGDFFARVDARRVNKKVLESLTKVGAFSAYGSRAQVLGALDDLRAKSKPNSPKLGNQQDLFGDMLSQETQAPVFQLDTNIEEFSDEQLASLERELLGFSLSAKPIDEILSGFRGYYTHKIGDIVSGEINSSKVKFACIVTSARVVITKATQSEMAFVRLSDTTGAIDGVVFPRLFKMSRGFWVDHKPLLVTGKIEHRDESPSVLIETVQTEADLQNEEGVFTISIPPSATPDNLKNLKQILLMHPGSQKVMLSFDGNRDVPLTFGVSWSENLSQSISELFFGIKDLPH